MILLLQCTKCTLLWQWDKGFDQLVECTSVVTKTINNHRLERWPVWGQLFFMNEQPIVGVYYLYLLLWVWTNAVLKGYQAFIKIWRGFYLDMQTRILWNCENCCMMGTIRPNEALLSKYDKNFKFEVSVLCVLTVWFENIHHRNYGGHSLLEQMLQDRPAQLELVHFELLATEYCKDAAMLPLGIFRY